MFCSNCGFDAKNGRFCPSCGSPVAGAAPVQVAPTYTVSNPYEEVDLWEGKPAGFADKAKGALNSVSYRITNQRIIISGGLISTTETEVEIRRINDIKVNQTFSDKIAKVGDITIYSTDPTEGVFVLKNVHNPIAVKEIIRKALNECRAAMNIIYRDKF